MTTKVTVDAHAGWPVEVTTIDLSADGTRLEHPAQIVAPNTVQDFYVHSHRALHVREMQHAAAPATTAKE